MEWLIYLLKASACLGLFYAFYHCFLQGLTFFSANRVYLLATLLSSFAIPAFQFEVERNPVASQEVSRQSPELVHEATGLTIASQSGSAELTPTFTQSVTYDWERLLCIGYAIVSITILMILVGQIFLLLRHTKKVHTTFGRLKVVYKPKGFTNCSFLNYVFVDQQDLSDYEINVLLRHEAVHASKYHTVDKFMISIGKILLWFNPFIYLYDKALEQVHEYQADKEASLDVGVASYAGLLLNISVKNNKIPLLLNFVENPIKARIKMLFINPSNDMKKLMYFLMLPVCCLLVWMFSVRVVYAELKQVGSDTNIGHHSKPGKFIEIVKELVAGPYGTELMDVIVVNSPRGKTLKTVLFKDYEIKFVINGVVYTLNQALNFDKDFINTLSENRGIGTGRYYNIAGVKNNDKVIWFGKQPALSDEELKTRIAKKEYEGNTVFGHIIAYSYLPDGKSMNGFMVKQASGKVFQAYVNPRFAVQVAKQLKIGDDIKIDAYNAYFSSDCNCRVIGSGTYVKNGKVIFDRDRFVVNDRKEGVKTNYRTLPEIQFRASDSVSFSSDRKIVDLYGKEGKAELQLDSLILNADHIHINNYSNIVTAIKARLTSTSGNLKLHADTVHYDLSTKKFHLSKK